MSSINVGLIGFGVAGAFFHAPLILAEPRMRLTAVATSRELPGECAGARRVADPMALSGAADVDLVVIASPNESHAPLAMAALAAGKHVVVDKPFALRLQQAEALIDLARQKQRLLTVFQNRRWDGNFLTFRECLASAAIGEVRYCEFHFDRFRPAPKAGWRESPVAGSGFLYDLGPHLIDQAIYLFGAPKAVFADVAVQRDGAVADDYFHLQLIYDRLRVVLHASALALQPGPRMMAHGAKGSLFQYGLDGQEAALREGKRPGHPDWGLTPEVSVTLFDAAGEHKINVQKGSYESFYRQVAAVILDGAPPPVALEEARLTMAVLDAARRSAMEKRMIAIL